RLQGRTDRVSRRHGSDCRGLRARAGPVSIRCGPNQAAANHRVARPPAVNPHARYAAITATLMSAAIPLGAALRHRYGPAAAARFTAGMSASVIAQQSLVGLVLRRDGSPRDPRRRRALSLVDAI